MRIDPSMTMEAILEMAPAAQRALFQRYHIGGCSACAFQPHETLAKVAADHNILDVDELDGANGQWRYDHDNDGLEDVLDTDDDNDGLTDWFESNDGNDETGQFDHDNDGIDDVTDDDDDGDGILDELEV